MTPDSNRKGKAANGKKPGHRRWIVDWTIEAAGTSGHISLSLCVASAADDSVCSSTTQHYLLQQDRLFELIRELSGTLEHSNASRLLEEQARANGSAQSNEPPSTSEMAEKEQSDLMSSHFSLGAYGLVGN